jgi:hypothetical protein
MRFQISELITAPEPSSRPALALLIALVAAGAIAAVVAQLARA